MRGRLALPKHCVRNATETPLCFVAPPRDFRSACSLPAVCGRPRVAFAFFGIWRIEIYLGFGDWDLGFRVTS
jgi:hypothetical protein